MLKIGLGTIKLSGLLCTNTVKVTDNITVHLPEKAILACERK